MYIEATLSANNNKEVLRSLLELRRRTNDHLDPPVTLLHGEETERLLRQTLLVIKDDEQKALEAKQRALENRVEVEEEQQDEEEEEEEALSMGSESEEKVTTFQQDLEMITDLSCFSCPQFTTKVMQGVNLRSLMCFDSH
jgi:hypothetical protein